MTKQAIKNNKELVTKVLFTIYLIILTWIILLKAEFTLSDLSRIRHVNLIPFGDPTMINNKVSYMEIYLNILIFIPFGIYISMLKPRWPFITKILPIFLVSSLFEIMQYIFAIGGTDITDVISNTLGGTFGALLYLLICKLLKNKIKTDKVFNLLALMITIFFIVLALFLYLTNI